MCDLSQASCETDNVNYPRTLSGLERVFDSFVFHKLRMHCVKAVVRKQIPMGFQKKMGGLESGSQMGVGEGRRRSR